MEDQLYDAFVARSAAGTLPSGTSSPSAECGSNCSSSGRWASLDAAELKLAKLKRHFRVHDGKVVDNEDKVVIKQSEIDSVLLNYHVVKYVVGFCSAEVRANVMV